MNGGDRSETRLDRSVAAQHKEEFVAVAVTSQLRLFADGGDANGDVVVLE